METVDFLVCPCRETLSVLDEKLNFSLPRSVSVSEPGL